MLCRRGELSPDGPLVYFYPGLPGREHVKLDRTALAGSLLGHRDLDTAAAKIETLREWAIADYLGQPAPFDFFRENPEGRFGLAVLTRDLDQWHQRPAELISDAGRIARGSDALVPDADDPPLRKAPRREIEQATRHAYDAAGEDRPNVNKIVKPVQTILRGKGYTASKQQIQQIAGQPEFKKRRRPVGVKRGAGQKDFP